jgi:hypothetical protein
MLYDITLLGPETEGDEREKFVVTEIDEENSLSAFHGFDRPWYGGDEFDFYESQSLILSHAFNMPGLEEKFHEGFSWNDVVTLIKDRLAKGEDVSVVFSRMSNGDNDNKYVNVLRYEKNAIGLIERWEKENIEGAYRYKPDKYGALIDVHPVFCEHVDGFSGGGVARFSLDLTKEELKVTFWNKTPTIWGIYRALKQVYLPTGMDWLRYILMAGKQQNDNRKLHYRVESWRGQSDAGYWRLYEAVKSDVELGLRGCCVAQCDESMYGKVKQTPVRLMDWYVLLKDMNPTNIKFEPGDLWRIRRPNKQPEWTVPDGEEPIQPLFDYWQQLPE